MMVRATFRIRIYTSCRGIICNKLLYCLSGENHFNRYNFMLLHQQFVRMARRHSQKLAIIDKTTQKNVTYSRALIGALILCSKFRKYEAGFIGIMIPTSAGCALATVGALMSGRIPVMINYSTGAEANAMYAQKKCKFKTIITSRALLEKIK